MMAIWKSYRSSGKLLSLIIVFAWCLSLLSTAAIADEESYFSNPAQAAHAANLAEASALSDEEAEAEQAYSDRLAEIGGMRASGMGWGEIAHAIGVHPSVLGLGHQKKARNSYTNQEMVEATERNTKTGYAKGHGFGLDTDDDGFGMASSKGLKSSNKSGVAGASGLSGNKGKSSSGNNKDGNGQGKGNNGGGNNGGGKGNGKK